MWGSWIPYTACFRGLFKITPRIEAMNSATQNSSSISETLKARKAHLIALLNIVDTKIGTSTEIQKLTITAIKAEMGLIEQKLKKY